MLIKHIGLSVKRPTTVPVFCRYCGRRLKDGHKKHRFEICNACKRE